MALEEQAVRDDGVLTSAGARELRVVERSQPSADRLEEVRVVDAQERQERRSRRRVQPQAEGCRVHERARREPMVDRLSSIELAQRSRQRLGIEAARERERGERVAALHAVPDLEKLVGELPRVRRARCCSRRSAPLARPPLPARAARHLGRTPPCRPASRSGPHAGSGTRGPRRRSARRRTRWQNGTTSPLVRRIRVRSRRLATTTRVRSGSDGRYTSKNHCLSSARA